MKLRTILAPLAAMVLAAAAGAQTKISMAGQCGRPEQQQTLAVPDRPNHSLVIAQAKCTYSKPWEIAGVQGKDGVPTETQDVSGNASRFRGYYVETMANGDKIHYRYEGSATLKDGVPQSVENKWSAIRGAGKFKGIKAQGTCKGKGTADGGLTIECEGEYTLPK